MKRTVVMLSVALLAMTLVVGCGGPFGVRPTEPFTGKPSWRFDPMAAQQVATPSCEDLLLAAETPEPIDPATGEPQGRFSWWPSSGELCRGGGPCSCPEATPVYWDSLWQ